MGEAKVTILIVSQAFAGVKRLERHKVINKAMKSFLDDGGEVHAVTMKCKSPEEYNR